MQEVHREQIIQELSQQGDVQLKDIVNEVFDSLRWTSVNDGVVSDISSLDAWRHRSLNEIEKDLAYLEIDRQRLLLALSTYLDAGGPGNKKLDWLFLNVLLYAEYIATVEVIRRKLLGVDGLIKSKVHPAEQHNFDVRPLINRWWHTPLYAVVVVGSFAVHPAAALVVGGLVFRLS